MKLVMGITVALLALAAWAQNGSELTARQLFLNTASASPQPTPKKTTPAKVKPAELPVKTPEVTVATDKQKPVDTSSHHTSSADTSSHIVQVNYTPLALKYSILQRKGNSFQEVDADTEFHSGDRIRVRVEANSPSYLYIVMGGSSGQWRVLFPSKDIAGGNNRIDAGQSCIIPPENDPAFYFDETAGVEKVSLVLSRTPEPDLEKLIYAAGDPTRQTEHHERTILAMNNPIDGALVGRLRDQVLSRDLVFEKYDGATPDGKEEKAVYAATKDKSPNARLFVDLKLVHK